MRIFFLITFLFYTTELIAQKKPLDHSVYDNWQRIGERHISPDGKWVVYTIEPQEGDNELIVQSIDGQYKKSIPRGYSATISRDSRFLVFKIKPFFSDTRQARIKKLKSEEFPKDSLGWLELGKEPVGRKAMARSYKMPAEGFGWVAYLTDSSRSTAESPGTLVLRDMFSGTERTYRGVTDYLFSKDGRKLMIEQAKDPKDTLGKSSVAVIDLVSLTVNQVIIGGNDFRNFSFSEDGQMLAFLAEREAGPGALQKFYRLWLYREGSDSAVKIADNHTPGMRIGLTVSEFGPLAFSKSGKRLFFGTSPVPGIRDTSIAEIDVPRLDIWHYNDDFLQTVQTYPARLRGDQQQNYLAVYDVRDLTIRQLGSRNVPQVIRTGEGDGHYFIGVTDTGRRIQVQWEGITRKDIYAINPSTGEYKLIRKNLHGQAYPSSTGKYILFYDRKARNYFSWDGDTVRNISSGIKVPLWNELSETPDDPQPYGVMRWLEDDEAVFVYDRYSIWKLDPLGKRDPKLVLNGRTSKKTYRYVQVDPEEEFLETQKPWVIRSFNNISKESGYLETVYSPELEKINIVSEVSPEMDMNAGQLQVARSRSAFLYSLESFNAPADLYSKYHSGDEWKSTRLTSINPQQKNYYWGKAELVNWKAFDGKESSGIVYKPENFDPKKKYPMIIYMYEDLSDNLHTYYAPAPIRSAINIPFFVSRGYVVFLPDIHYRTGQPGRDAYNYVVSGTQALLKKGFVDARRIGIQGHSWGGYEVAYLITKTNLFKAAWAGAPVANMTSAYGGIRWESGVSRQWQYEKSQSRLGASLWENPKLYIDNSPLFHLDKVKTPLVIMHNDADGAVPWYQGIELFTGLRRLGKKVWLLNYNGQGHGLTQRQDMRDYQVRMQQFFDWQLKDAVPPRWLREGVPAIRKGLDLGLE